MAAVAVGCSADPVSAEPDGTTGPSVGDEGTPTSGDAAGTTAVDPSLDETTAPPADDSTSSGGTVGAESTTEIDYTSGSSGGPSDGSSTGIVYEGECPDEDIGSTVPQTVSDSTVGADNTLVGTCGGDTAGDHAYLFTAPSTGLYTFTTENSDYDTVLYLLEDCEGLMQLTCNDNSGSSETSRVERDLSQDDQVVIVVDGENGEEGNYELTIELDVCPDEDLGSTVPNTVNGDTSTEMDTSTPSCVFGASNDYAYTFTAPHTGTFVFDTFGSSYDTGLYIYDGATCSGTELACNDDTAGLQSQVVVDLVEDQVITVIVDGYSGASGSYTLNIAAPICGDDTLDEFEDCDGDDVGAATCITQGFVGGTLACDDTCNFDVSGCNTCGDDIVDGGDVCDNTALDMTRCEDLGYDGGSLDCADDCSGFDESQCMDGIIVACSSPGAAITDLTLTADTIDVVDSGSIADIDVFVDITHTYAGDLEITLNGEDLGLTTLMTDDNCLGPNDVWAFFNDEGAVAAGVVCIEPYAIEGNVIPDNPLNVFDTMEAMGSWTLEVYDDAGADQGTLNEWCVYITLEP